ncbi:MAG: DUF1559 domain-containing protein, partial [Planctomycetota bacterium]|nr:DUF1559 domain-containing protein [Planctomycetota bacterium]
LLPFLENQAIFNLIRFDVPAGKQMTISGKPFNINYQAYAQAEGLFICPTDPNTGRVISENNYRCNFGGTTPYGGAMNHSNQNRNDVVDAQGYPVLGNGAFSAGDGLKTGDFEDGLSKTCFFSERNKGSTRNSTSEVPTLSDISSRPGGRIFAWPMNIDEFYQACSKQAPTMSEHNFTLAGRWPSDSDWSNGWPFAGYDSTQYNHVAPPNWKAMDCGGFSSIPDTPGEHAIIAARSDHKGIVNVAFGDGHVQSVGDNVDLAVWRAMGSRNGGEALPGGE